LNQYRIAALLGYPYGTPPLGYLFGPNSNTFVNDLFQSCGITSIQWPHDIPPFNLWRYIVYSPMRLGGRR
jgi:hypothetical protein